MIAELKSLAEQKGYKLEFVPIQMLKSFEQGLIQFTNEPYLYHKQRANVESQIPYLHLIGQPSKYTSIIIIAVPRRNFSIHEKAARALIKDAIKKAGHAVKNHDVLPFKRLAVQSGLAKYGRNNITYVDGMGSFCKYLALLTSVPCDGDSWREEPIMTETCEDCHLCINSCPKGAISKDRFLLYREKCVGGGGCSACQDCCPLNKKGMLVK